jgi:hypothetical protein
MLLKHSEQLELRKPRQGVVATTGRIPAETTLAYLLWVDPTRGRFSLAFSPASVHDRLLD